MSNRWSYKVVELKTNFLGVKAKTIEEALNQLGMQGWELVSAVPSGIGMRLYMKKSGA